MPIYGSLTNKISDVRTPANYMAGSQKSFHTRFRLCNSGPLANSRVVVGKVLAIPIEQQVPD